MNDDVKMSHLVLPSEEGRDEGDEEDGDVGEEQHGQHLAQPEQVVAEAAGAAPHHVAVHHQHHQLTVPASLHTQVILLPNRCYEMNYLRKRFFMFQKKVKATDD